MRISQALVSQLASQRTASAQRSYVGAVNRVSADQRVGRPADDPISAARIDRLTRQLGKLDAMGDSRRTVKTDLTAAETILGDVHDRIVRAQELAIDMGSDDSGPDERANAALEVRAIFDQIVGFMNQRQPGGNYLFGGLQDGAPPFDPRGVYQGDQQHRYVEVGPGYNVRATVDGVEAMGQDGAAFEALANLVAALEANDSEAIRGALDPLDDARSQVSRARTDVGTRIATMIDLDDLTLDLTTTLELEVAGLQAVDIGRGASDLATAEAVLTAVVQTSRSLLQSGSGSWLR